MLFTIMCLCVFVGWKCVKLLRWLKTCQRFFQIWIVSHRQQRTRTSLTELKAGAVFFSDELLLFYCNRRRCDASSSWIVGLSWKSQRILLMGLLIHSDKDFCCVMDGSHWENTLKPGLLKKHLQLTRVAVLFQCETQFGQKILSQLRSVSC